MRPTFSPSAASRPSTDCRCARPTRIFHTCITTQQEMVRECAAHAKSLCRSRAGRYLQYSITQYFEYLAYFEPKHFFRKILNIFLLMKTRKKRSQKLLIIGPNFFFQYCQSAQNQAKSYIVSLHEFYIITLAA